MKFASCCLLSYERPDFLRTALATLVAHAEYPLELIVHDDGSENPEVHIALRQLVDRGLISTLIQNSPGHNEGVGVAVNRTFDVARGDFLLKLDQDLVFEPGWLRKGVEIMEKNEEESSILKQPYAEPPIGALGFFRYPVEPVKYEDMFVRDWGSGATAWEEHQDFVGSAMMFTRDLWERARPFPERSAAFAEDLEFKNKLKEHGFKMALPKEGDLVRNLGFGYGPSTVVAKDAAGELTASKIKEGPRLLGGATS